MPLRRAALALALSVALAAPAAAQAPILARSGTWEVLGGPGTASPRLCGLAAQDGAHHLRLLHPSGGDDVTLEIGDTAWSFPPGIALDVTMQFEDHRLWTEEIAAQTGPHGRPAILLSLHTSNLAALLDEFGRASHLHVRFRHAGTAHRWTVALRGARAAAAHLQSCLAAP